MGKEVTNVEVLLEGEQPRFATFHYETKNKKGSVNIDLSQKILLDKPEKPNLTFKFRKKN